MKQKHHNNISENQVEEALVSNLSFLKQILQTDDELKLLARQLRLLDGEQRLDLLLIGGKTLYLIELKVVKFSSDCLEQILSYKNELLNLQNADQLVQGNIKSYLLVTDATTNNVIECRQKGIEVIIYEPAKVLTEYYNNLSAVAPFLKLKPNDYGVYNLGLINRAINQLGYGEIKRVIIAEKTKLSPISTKNHLLIGKELGLVRIRNYNYFLTDLGDEYFLSGNKDALSETLTGKQIEILKIFVAKDPFYSSTVFGIYCIIESAFFLARNFYPIDLLDLRKMFRVVSGKVSEWQTDTSLSTATYTFLNFAVDLELLGKIGKKIVITPAGFKFILMLQLHKSIEMVESLSSN